MFLKVVRILIVLVILFSYLPIMHMDGCPYEKRTENAKMNCGYTFHCPFISTIIFTEPIALLNLGRMVLITPLPLLEDLEYPIFHPPEAL